MKSSIPVREQALLTLHLVDSSVWVGLFLDFDTQHAKAERFFSNLKGGIYLPYCVLNETVTVLAYKHSKKQADQFLNFVGRDHKIKLIEDNIEEESSFFKSLTARISFTDAALLLLKRKLKANLVTFDEQLERLAKRDRFYA